MGVQQQSSLDVLVVAYNSENEVGSLLASLGPALPGDARVLIWSNSPIEPLQAAVREAAAGMELEVVVLGDGTNLGFAGACNELAAKSTADRVMFLNPDTTVRRLPAALGGPTTVLAPVIEDEKGRLQRTFGPERTLGAEIRMRLLRREPALRMPLGPEEVGFCSGACFVVGRREFLDLGGFDTAYFMYYEDLDWSRRWRAAGGSIVVDPEFSIMHIGGVSASSNRLLALQRSFDSALRFHGNSRLRRMGFYGVAMVEAVAKSFLTLFLGRVGIVDRRTQWAFTRWLMSVQRMSGRVER